MLPRLHRLRQTKAIQHTLHTGTCFTTPYIKVCYIPSQAAQTRVACVVGKSVHRSAVRRHRYQRQLREIVRHLLAEEPLPRPYDMVWMAKSSIQKAPSLGVILAAVKPSWQKLRDTL